MTKQSMLTAPPSPLTIKLSFSFKSTPCINLVIFSLYSPPASDSWIHLGLRWSSCLCDSRLSKNWSSCNWFDAILITFKPSSVTFTSAEQLLVAEVSLPRVSTTIADSNRSLWWNKQSMQLYLVIPILNTQQNQPAVFLSIAEAASYTYMHWQIATSRILIATTILRHFDITHTQTRMGYPVRVLWNSSPFEDRVSRELGFSSLLSVLSPRKDLS